MNKQKYEPEEFARARYWQERYMELEEMHTQMLEEAETHSMKFFCKEVEKMENRLKEEYNQKLNHLNGKISELEIRLEDHRQEMEIFNFMPWYERMFHKFDLDNI